MDSSNTYSDCSSDFFKINSMELTSSIVAVNSEPSIESDSDDNVSLITPYQFKPSTELLDSSREESAEEDGKNDETLLNMDW